MEKTFVWPNSKVTTTNVPIMAANMDSVATPAAAKVLQEYNMFSCLHKFIDYRSIDNYGLDKNNFALTIGLNDDDLDRVLEISHKFDILCVDVANGYTQNFVDFLKKVKDKLPDHAIIAGNVCTPDGCNKLAETGISAVKVGIGPGQQCLTRKKTGIGYPQFSAIVDCIEGLSKDVLVIGDGGCKTPADVAKGLAAGADFIMVGSMLAAHTENSNVVAGKVEVYGMSSTAAMRKHYGKVDTYRSSEGRVSSVKFRGDLSVTILDLLGGIRSTCTYVGAATIGQLHENAEFIRVNNQLATNYEQYTVSD